MDLAALIGEAQTAFDANPVMTSSGRKTRAGRRKNERAELVKRVVVETALRQPQTEAEAAEFAILLLPIWQQVLLWFVRTQLQSLVVDIAKWVFQKLQAIPED